MVRVAINGFGRIGRLLLRAGIDDPDIEWVAINDLADNKNLAYLFRYDSIQGRFEGDVDADDSHITINGKKIPIFSEKDPLKLPWEDLDVDIVAECTGRFTKSDDARMHLEAGAKKVLVSAPCKCEGAKVCPPDQIKTIVLGVNEDSYDKEKHHVISNASCTTNCAAPVIKVLNDAIGIKKGLITTIHAYTATQRLVDAPHKDLRRGRAAASNIIPTTTGAAIAVTETIPQLQGKLDGLAIRVPVLTGSITDFTIEVKRETTSDEVNQLFKKAAEGRMKGVLKLSSDPLVSSDIIHDLHSAIVDGEFTEVVHGNLVKVLAWYDNEWGFSNRMVDLLKILL